MSDGPRSSRGTVESSTWLPRSDGSALEFRVAPRWAAGWGTDPGRFRHIETGRFVCDHGMSQGF